MKSQCKNPACRSVGALSLVRQGSRAGWFLPADEAAVPKPQLWAFDAVAVLRQAKPEVKDDESIDAEICLLMVENMGGHQRSFHRERSKAFRRVVSEVCSPPRLTSMIGEMAKQGLGPGFALDLSCIDPDDNEPWDLSIPAKQQKALKMVREQKPLFLVGSPCCRAFSS